MTIQTPWGTSQDIEQTGEAGIAFVSTASHGGYLLDVRHTKAMREGMPSAFGRCIGAGIMAEDGGSWWEEDCAWAYVCRAFPEAFPAMAHEAAEKTIEWIEREPKR